MKITLNFLIDTDAVGILARITLLVMEKDFTIVERSKENSKSDKHYHLILSLSYNRDELTDKITNDLIQELRMIEQVHEVLKTDLKNKDLLLSIGNNIVQKYPNVIGYLNDYAKKLDENGEENKAEILHEVGEMVGKKIALNHYKLVRIDGSITKALKKIVLPVISPFALAKIIDNELHVSVCPFCMGIDSSTVTTPQCDFLTGLILGLIKTKQNVHVKEIKCRSQNHAACIFLVSKQY
ncbi:MAG: V4R domain-containing protein [Methylococcales bacterium]|nr:V4R domain-containing protein [Methylococcales bacterium]